MGYNATIAVISGMKFEANIAGGPGIINVYGLNPIKLTGDIEQAISNGAAGLISFGTAAGLRPSLSAGTIIIAQQVTYQNHVFLADAQWGTELKRQLPDVLFATIAGVDHAISTPKEKSLLYSGSGAAIADMESHLVARIALQYNLPFTALRVVLDNAECALPPAALAATKSDGTIDYIGLLSSLLAYPRQLSALLQLATAQAQAKKALLRCSQGLKGNLFGFMDRR